MSYMEYLALAGSKVYHDLSPWDFYRVGGVILAFAACNQGWTEDPEHEYNRCQLTVVCVSSV